MKNSVRGSTSFFANHARWLSHGIAATEIDWARTEGWLLTSQTKRASSDDARRSVTGMPLLDVLDADAEPGDVVLVRTEKGRPIGWALWSSESLIALRMVAGATGTTGATGERSALARVKFSHCAPAFWRNFTGFDHRAGPVERRHHDASCGRRVDGGNDQPSVHDGATMPPCRR